MAALKRDTTFNELFIKPIHRLYDDQAITVEEFKDRYEALSKADGLTPHTGKTD